MGYPNIPSTSTVTLGNPFNRVLLQDASYIVTAALPNAANTVNTNSLDLGGLLPNVGTNANIVNYADQSIAVPYPVTSRVLVNITSPLASGSANSKNVNYVLQHTGALANGAVDTTNWTNVDTAHQGQDSSNFPFANPILKVADNGNTNTVAGSVNLVLPPGIKRFIRAQAVGEANGGQASGNFTLQLYFYW